MYVTLILILNTYVWLSYLLRSYVSPLAYFYAVAAIYQSLQSEISGRIFMHKFCVNHNASVNEDATNNR